MPDDSTPPLKFNFNSTGQVQLQLAKQTASGPGIVSISNVGLNQVLSNELNGTGSFAIRKVYGRIFTPPSGPSNVQNPWDDPGGVLIEGWKSGFDEKTWHLPYDFSTGQPYTVVVWLIYQGSNSIDRTEPPLQIGSSSSSSS